MFKEWHLPEQGPDLDTRAPSPVRDAETIQDPKDLDTSPTNASDVNEHSLARSLGRRRIRVQSHFTVERHGNPDPFEGFWGVSRDWEGRGVDPFEVRTRSGTVGGTRVVGGTTSVRPQTWE